MSDRRSAVVGDRPRILMSTPHFFPSMGGVETHVDEVSSRLATMGFDVTVLVADASGTLPEQEARKGVNIRRVRAWPRDRDYLFAPGLSKVVNSGDWDVVHVQCYHTLVAPTVMLAARRAGIPYVLTFHAGGHSSALRRRVRGLQLRSLRPLLASASRLVVNLPFEIDRYGPLLRLEPSRFTQIPNGCDLPVPTQEIAARANGTLLLSVGRLERYKGHRRAIAGFACLQREVPDARLRIAGTGPDEDELRAYAEELGVGDAVEIRGVPPSERGAMASLLASADLVVLLSELETHPMAVLEALALGRPTLLADTPGLSQLAGEGMARAIPLESSPEAVAGAMLSELASPTVSGPVRLPTWDDCATSHAELYAGVSERTACAS